MPFASIFDKHVSASEHDEKGVAVGVNPFFPVVGSISNWSKRQPQTNATLNTDVLEEKNSSFGLFNPKQKKVIIVEGRHAISISTPLMQTIFDLIE